MFNLNHAISEWRRQMIAGGVTTPAVLDELESHLREDVERQTRAGTSEQQAFDAAVKKLGPASALKTEFRKSGLSAALEKMMIAVAAVFVAFIIFLTTAAMILCYSRLGDRLMGFVTLGFLLVAIFGWRRAAPFLPVIPSKQKRWAMEILCLLLGFGISTFYVQVIVHRFEVPGGMLPAIGFWAVFPIAIGFGIACGIEEAARQAATPQITA